MLAWLKKIFALLFKKKEEEAPSGMTKELLSFLNDSYALYKRAWEYRDLRVLQSHFTIPCIRMIQRYITLMYSVRSFGESSFVNIQWAFAEESPEGIRVRLDVTSKDISVGGSLKIGLIQPFSEYWDISITDDTYMVTKITQIGTT